MVRPERGRASSKRNNSCRKAVSPNSRGDMELYYGIKEEKLKRKLSRVLGVALALALLCSMIVGAVPVSAVIGQPTVTLAANTISAAGDYVIVFDSYFPLTGETGANAADKDYITVVFPVGTTAPGFVGTNIKVAAKTAVPGTSITGALSGTWTAATRTLVLYVPFAETTTGAAKVTITIAATALILNPATPGDYTLTVKTSAETTAVTSTAYTVGIPGLATRYNKYGNFVASTSGTGGLATEALAASNYDVIKAGAGTYTAVTLNASYVIIESTGTAAETIIKGVVTINGNYNTLDDFTLKGAHVVANGADYNTIQNCVFTKTSALTGAEVMLTSSGIGLTVKDSTFDMTVGVAADTGFATALAASTTTIKNCTFSMDLSAGLVADMAINSVVALTGTGTLTVDGCTFTGADTVGYYDASTGSIGVTIKNSTFDGVGKAVETTAAATAAVITVSANTIKNCTTSATAPYGAIEIAGGAAIAINGNTIQGNAGYSVNIAATPAGNVSLTGNNIFGNTKGLRSLGVIAAATKAENNWWGATSGPTIATNIGGTGEIVVGAAVDYTPWFKASVGKASTVATVGGTAKDLNASTTVGVAIEGVTTAAASVITLAKYDANPTTVAPKYTALTGAYFDVYTAASSTTTVNLKFYASGITVDTDAYVYSALEQKWVACSDQGVSGTGDFVWVTVKTTLTTPVAGDLVGTPFVLVKGPATPALAAPTIIAPVAGATLQPIRPTFMWTAVTGALAYELDVSDNYLFRGEAAGSPPLISRTGIPTAAYALQQDLEYDSTYYWRIRATTTTGTVEGIQSVWVISVFSTKSAPAVVEEEVLTCGECGLTFDTRAALESHLATAHAPVAPALPTTPAYIWVIIGVGAVLVIALIALIVRTRRAA